MCRANRRSRPASWILGAILSVLPILHGCERPRETGARTPTVVVTIFPIADLLARLGGDAIQVETLLPPRASPATWEATPGQIRAIGRAAGYVSVGGGLDGWLDDFVDGGRVPILRLTEDLSLRDADPDHGHTGTGDPHVWLDPVLVRDRLLPEMTAFLEHLVPSESRALRNRAETLADSLTALDTFIGLRLSGVRTRAFVATHDAWWYFAARYGLTPLGSLYERPGSEPSTRSLARLVDAARAEGVGAVLAEPQLARSAARALSDELAVGVIVVDPLGGAGLEGRESYFDLMRFNARAFAGALGGPTESP